MKVAIASLWAALLCLTACGGGSASSTDPNSTSVAPISGNWQISLQKSAAQKSTEALSGFLSGTNDKVGAVTGSALYTAASCAGIGSVSGTVSGSNVTLSVNPTGLNINLTGTLTTGTQLSMSGNYTLLASGCGKPEMGTWTGIAVPSLNGTLTGTLTPAAGSPDYPVTAVVSQGKSTGASSAPLTGTLTSGSTGSACFPPGAISNISGLISGDSVVVDLANSASVPLGQVTGTWPFDPKVTPSPTTQSLTGAYKIASQGPKGTPCSKGESGTICLSTDASVCPASSR